MRRRLHGAVLSLSVLALGAAPPAVITTPTPKPIVTAAPVLPTATATPKANYAPAVVVYPFEQSGQMDANVGSSIARIFSQVFVEAGGLTVRAVPNDVKRADFSTDAKKNNLDFYVTGYVTPIGNGASVVEQVVKVSSGVIVYSRSQTIFSVPDATSLALDTHNVILQAAGVSVDVTPQPQATSTNDPSTANGAQVNLGGLGGVLQSIFRRGGKSSATPVPATAATPISKPRRGVIVTKVTGNAGEIAQADQELQRRLAVNYNIAQSSVPGSTAATAADSICGTNRDNTIASGVLDRIADGRRSKAQFTLTIRTCFGSVLFTSTQSDADWHKAVDAAVAEFVKADPGNS